MHLENVWDDLWKKLSSKLLSALFKIATKPTLPDKQRISGYKLNPLVSVQVTKSPRIVFKKDIFTVTYMYLTEFETR